jgi:four helix bundle protein
VSVRCFEDLVAWQLAFELQKEILAFTAQREVRSDRDYCLQLRDSIASVTRNTAEGFGRFRPREFARFLEIAHGSLDETKSHLHDALLRGYLSEAEHQRLVALTRRALAANVRLGAYLRKCASPKER